MDLIPTIEYYTGKKIKIFPEIAVFEWCPKKEYINKNHQFDYEDVIHADVFYPTFKAFIYLNDVSKENGSFVYVPYSHIMSFGRLLFEYLLSIIYTFSVLVNKTKTDDPQLDIPQPHKFSQNWMKYKDFKPLPIEAKKNTLILANTMGYHGRSKFIINKSRKILFLNFRYMGT